MDAARPFSVLEQSSSSLPPTVAGRFFVPVPFLFELVAMKNSSFILAFSCASSYDVMSLFASVLTAVGPLMLCLL
jgi:hypothetical protein